MALLDVSEVINDPLFTSPVTLIKSAETISEGGEPVWQDAASADAQAVVTSDQKAIDRLPDAPPGYGAAYDAVIWRGRRFVVKDCADYSQFGAGFLRLTCWPEEVSDGSY